jgi:hypothetical protein
VFRELELATTIIAKPIVVGAIIAGMTLLA